MFTHDRFVCFVWFDVYGVAWLNFICGCKMIVKHLKCQNINYRIECDRLKFTQNKFPIFLFDLALARVQLWVCVCVSLEMFVMSHTKKKCSRIFVCTFAVSVPLSLSDRHLYLHVRELVLDEDKERICRMVLVTGHAVIFVDGWARNFQIAHNTCGWLVFFSYMFFT